MAELHCPKCGSEWRTYERSGLAVDQCTGCRGIFLDRGELERLIDAEGAYYERMPHRHEHHEEHYEHRGHRGGLEQLGGLGGLLGSAYGHHGHGHKHHKRHKRESFLSELFD